VNIETIRYYERIEMLPAPPRTASGRRVYGPAETRSFTFIRRSREHGFKHALARRQIEIGHARLPSFVTDRSSSGGRPEYCEYHAARRVYRDAAIASAIEAMSFLTSEGSTPSLFIIWRTTHEASSSSRLACPWGAAAARMAGASRAVRNCLSLFDAFYAARLPSSIQELNDD
jgi:DNA-binding transcriptional MerR regulator